MSTLTLFTLAAVVVTAVVVAWGFSRVAQRVAQERYYILSLNEDERRKYFRQKWELREKRRRASMIAMLAVILAAIGLFLGIWAFNLSL